MKRVNCFILTLILLFGFAVSVAAEGESIRITYAGANLPEIVVNAQTDNMDIDCQDVTLNFDGKTVNASSAEKYDKSKHSRRVFFLLDLSTSMKAKYFTSAKECIADFADNMGENTTVYLITFGKDVSCVLDGSNDAGEIKSVLSTLSNNQGGTKFFAAIKQAMDISDACPMADMEYAVVFSDGEDFQTGDTTQKEVEDKIGKSAMPIYAMRAETGRVSASDIGIFRSLVAESHGKMYSYSTENAVEVFDDLNSETASQYIIHADTGSNVFNGLSQLLYLKVNGIQSEQISFAAKSKTDITAPEIISEPVISKKDNTITFEISEDIINSANVSPTKDDFSLYTKKGKNVEISDVIYEKTDNGYLLTVCPKKKIVKCEYRLICKDITDNSIEKNPLPQTYVFKSNVGISAFSAFIRNYWYAFIIALTVILLIVIMLVKHRFIVADRCLPKGSLVMGTSNYDSLFGYSGDTTWYMNTIAVPHTDVMYGGDGDDVLLPQTGDDYIIGGKGDDRIYGDTGDDVYFYSQGDGTDTIIDSSGNDEIWLLNYTKEQLKKFKIDTKSDNNYILVYDDVGTLIFKIWKTSGTSTHSMDIKYVTDEKTESYTRLVDWNRVKSVRKLKFACPVDIGIYNGNGDLVTTLYDGEESLFSDDNGVYSVVYDGEKYVKCIDVSDESYSFVISGKDNGTMSIDECFESDDGKLLTEYTAKSVPVYKASTYKLSLNGDDEPKLDGTEYNVEFDKKQYVPVLSAKMKKDNIRIAVEKGKQLSVSVNPKNADNKNVEWASMDESIATVDENGYVKGVAPGETTVVAEIDGKTAVCTVNVAEKQFNYLILIIPGALILLTAVGVLIVVAVKRKNKKTLVPCENGQHRKSAFCGRLKVVSGNQFGQEYSLDSQNEKSVGKAQDCDIKLDESYKKVSRRHCVIKLSENGLGYEVMDTSSNGTYVQKIRLPRNEFAFIPAGATLLLADAECELLLLPPIRNS